MTQMHLSFESQSITLPYTSHPYQIGLCEGALSCMRVEVASDVHTTTPPCLDLGRGREFLLPPNCVFDWYFQVNVLEEFDVI